MISLRPYQAAAVERVRAELRAGRRRVCLAAPTGAGKTVIASHVIAGALAKGSKTLFVAHRRELVQQPYRKLLENGIPPEHLGLIMAGCADRPAAAVQIASIQTLARRRERPPADLVIVDEAHRVLARSYLELIRQEYPAAVVLGLTATPYRGDGRGLGDVFEELVVVSSYHGLAAEGWLVEPTVWTVPPASLPDLEGVPVRGSDYEAAELQARCDRPELVGSLVDHYQRRGNGAAALVFASGVRHSRTIRDAFLRAGIPAAHVDGNTPTAERAELWHALEWGLLQVLTNCDVATEGVDIPAVKCVILARPTRSLRVYLQQCGRGSRPYCGRPFVVLDHAGVAPLFGLPQEDREWSLEGRAGQSGRERLPAARTCRGCQAVLPPSVGVCPECGWVFPPPAPRPEPKTVLGQLRQLLEEPAEIRWARTVAIWRAENRGRVRPAGPERAAALYRVAFGAEPPGELPELTAAEAHRLARWRELVRDGYRQGLARGTVFARATAIIRQEMRAA